MGTDERDDGKSRIRRVPRERALGCKACGAGLMAPASRARGRTLCGCAREEIPPFGPR